MFFPLRSDEARAAASGARVVDEGSTSLRVRQTLTVFSQGGELFVYGYRSRHVLVAVRILAKMEPMTSGDELMPIYSDAV